MPIKTIYFVRHKNIFDGPLNLSTTKDQPESETFKIVKKSRKKDGNLDVFLYLYADTDHHSYTTFQNSHRRPGVTLREAEFTSRNSYFSRAFMALNKVELGYLIDVFDTIVKVYEANPCDVHPIHEVLASKFELEWDPSAAILALCAKKQRDYLIELRDELPEDEVVSILMEEK
jgi:hypothetical protein